MMREAVFSILTLLKFTFAAVQMPSHIWLFMTPMDCSTLGFPVLHHVSELTQTHVHWVCDAIQPSCFCCPLLLLPSVFPFIRVFSYESALHIRWPKHWSFSFSISPSSNEYSGLISFRIDWLDILVVQLTLKSLLKHHNLKASILWHWTFFMVQLSHPYMKMKVAQLCPTCCESMDYTIHGILWARILECVAFPFSRESSQPRDQTQVSHIAGGFFTSWVTREAQEYWSG